MGNGPSGNGVPAGASPRMAPPRTVQGPPSGAVQVGYRPDGTPYIVGVNTPGANVGTSFENMAPAKGVTTPAQLALLQHAARVKLWNDTIKWNAARAGGQQNQTLPNGGNIPPDSPGGGSGSAVPPVPGGGAAGLDTLRQAYANSANQINQQYGAQSANLNQNYTRGANAINQSGSQLQHSLASLAKQGALQNAAANRQVANQYNPALNDTSGQYHQLLNQLHTQGADVGGLNAELGVINESLGAAKSAQTALSARYGQIFKQAVNDRSALGQVITHGQLGDMQVLLANGLSSTELAKSNALATNSANEANAIAAQQLAIYQATAAAAAASAKARASGGGSSKGGVTISTLLAAARLGKELNGSAGSPTLDYGKIFSGPLGGGNGDVSSVAESMINSFSSGQNDPTASWSDWSNAQQKKTTFNVNGVKVDPNSSSWRPVGAALAVASANWNTQQSTASDKNAQGQSNLDAGLQYAAQHGITK